MIFADLVIVSVLSAVQTLWVEPTFGFWTRGVFMLICVAGGAATAWVFVVRAFARETPCECEIASESVAPGLPTYTCPRCGMTSYNLNDIREKYCGNCHRFEESQR